MTAVEAQVATAERQNEPNEPDGGSNSSRRRQRERERGLHVNTLGLCNCHAGCSVLLYLAPRLVEGGGTWKETARDRDRQSSKEESIHNEAYTEALSTHT